MQSIDLPFWKYKGLSEMTDEEWESLCDRCGRCCLNKIEDEGTGHFYYTNVACSLLDSHHASCRAYDERFKMKPDCLGLNYENIANTGWLPSTCAYRLLDEGKELYWWHPLVSGDTDALKNAGISVCGKTVNEENIHPDQLQDHIVDWI